MNNIARELHGRSQSNTKDWKFSHDVATAAE